MFLLFFMTNSFEKFSFYDAAHKSIPGSMHEFMFLLFEILLMSCFTSSFLMLWYNHRHAFYKLWILYCIYGLLSLVSFWQFPVGPDTLLFYVGSLEMLVGLGLVGYLWRQRLYMSSLILLPFVVLDPFSLLIVSIMLFPH